VTASQCGNELTDSNECKQNDASHGGVIDAITLTPEQGALRIELKGNLGAILSAATNAKRSPEIGDLSLQVEMVAGAHSRWGLAGWWVAA
jgi:hypothetical protein